jgi:hypothetical protein
MMAQMVTEFVSRLESMQMVAWLSVLMVVCSGSQKFFFRIRKTVVHVMYHRTRGYAYTKTVDKL